MGNITIKKVDVLLMLTGLAFAFVAPYLAYLQDTSETIPEIIGELWPLIGLGVVAILCALVRG